MKEIDAHACKDEKSQKGKFIDIGANTGHYSLSLAKRSFTQIIAIEPNPPSSKLLVIKEKIKQGVILFRR